VDLPPSLSLLVRSDSGLAKTTALLRQRVQALDPDVPLFSIRTLDSHLAQRRWPFRVFGGTFLIFACVALALAAVGLYSE